MTEVGIDTLLILVYVGDPSAGCGTVKNRENIMETLGAASMLA